MFHHVSRMSLPLAGRVLALLRSGDAAEASTSSVTGMAYEVDKADWPDVLKPGFLSDFSCVF